MGFDLWALVVIGGPIALVVVLLLVWINNRTSGRQLDRTEDATRRLYEEQDRIDKARDGATAASAGTPLPAVSPVEREESPMTGPADDTHAQTQPRPNLSTEPGAKGFAENGATETQPAPNISTEGDARSPSDTLDRGQTGPGN